MANPRARAPAFKNVSVAERIPSYVFPSTKARIVFYASPPGTSGISPGNVKIITGVLTRRAKI